MRSINLRLPEDPSKNRRSISGVSQTILKCLVSSDCPLVITPSILITLRLRWSRPFKFSTPVPSISGPPTESNRTATAQLSVTSSLPINAISPRGTWRRPLPGAKNDRASIRLVLPAPLLPVSTTGVTSSSSLRER